MYKSSTVGVVIPAYNEERFVGDVIATIPEFVDWVFPIDDCSSDNTWTEIQKRATAMNRPDDSSPSASDGGEDVTLRVVPIRHKTNQGRGAAVKTGYRTALAHDIDVIAVMDGDGQMDPANLERLIGPIVDGEADYVKGNRLLTASHRHEMSSWRFFGNNLLTLLTRIASGNWEIMDPQNGYTAISAETLDEIDIDALYDNYGFLNDLLVVLNTHEMQIIDVPMQAVYGEEESGISYPTFVPQLSTLLLKSYLSRLRETYLRMDAGLVGAFFSLGVLAIIAILGRVVIRVADKEDKTEDAPDATILLANSLLLFGLLMVVDWWYNNHSVL